MVTIDDRLTQNVEDDAIYLLVDPTDRRIAGNLQHWPRAARSHDWYELPIERAGMRSLALVQSFELPGGFHLLIGRDVQVRAQLRSLLTDALFWALLVVLVMATAGALVVRSLFRRTLANVSATAAAIAAGDFTQRVKLSGRGDEFDQLAETINDMLDRIGAADGGRARGVQRHRARSAHADHPCPRPAGGRRAACVDARNCAPRSSGRPPTSTASSRCSRPCCASPRSRPARVARPSPRSTWRRCSPMWRSSTGRWPRRTASR